MKELFEEYGLAAIAIIGGLIGLVYTLWFVSPASNLKTLVETFFNSLM